MEARFIGKGKYDKKFHLIQNDKGIAKRICVWGIVYGEILLGEEITCENCLIRQYDNDWEAFVNRSSTVDITYTP